MRHSIFKKPSSYKLHKTAKTWRQKITTLAVVGVQLSALAFPTLAAQRAFAYTFPSTNGQNRTSNLPHVDLISTAVGSVSLQFINNTDSQAFFEIRKDGVATGTTPHPIIAGDTIHTGGVSVDNRTSAIPQESIVNRTITATTKVEVRLALGGERDWDFNWTAFNVLPAPDTTKPVVTIGAPAVNSYNPSTISVNATDNEALNRVTANIYNETNSTLIRSCSQLTGAVTAFTLNCNAASLPNGIYTIRTNAKDAAGNTSNTLTRQFTVDITRPHATITTPVTNSVQGSSFTIEGTAYDNETHVDHVNIYVAKVAAGGGFGGYVVNNQTATYNAATKQFTYNVSSLANGPYTIKAVAFDAAGNSQFANTVAVTVDGTKPSIVFNTPGLNSYNPTSISVSATDDLALDIVTAHIYDATNTTLLKNCSKTATPVNTTTYTLDCPISGLGNGVYTIRANARDSAGNISTTLTRQFTIDTTRPNATITAPVSNSYQISDFTVLGTASDNETHIDHVNIYIAKVAAGGGFGGYVVDNQSATYNPVTKQFTYDVTGLADGSYTIKAVAFDAAGNSHFANTVLITVDTTKPSTPVINTPLNNQYFNTAPILNSWSASTDSLSGIDKYQVEYIYVDGHTFTGGPTRDVPGTQTSRNHTPGMSEQGGVTIRVRAIDGAGNVGDWSNPVYYTYDATAPAAPTLLSPANNAVVKGQNLTNDWADVADAAYYIYESYNVDGSGNCIMSPTRFNTTYTASNTNTRDVADLAFCWRVKAVDAAGNQSAWSDLWKVTTDNIAPFVQITTPVNGDLLSGNVTISGVVTDANPHHYYLVVQNSGGGYVAGPQTVNAATVADFIWDTTLVADGTYTIRLEARDAAGNKTSLSVATISVTVDNTAPVVTANALTTTTNSPELTGTIDDALAAVAVTVNGTTYTSEVVIAGNTWTLPAGTIAPALTVNTYTVDVTATDAAGNSSTDSATLEIETAAAPAVVTPTPPVVLAAATNTPNNPAGGRGAGFQVATGDAAATAATTAGEVAAAKTDEAKTSDNAASTTGDAKDAAKNSKNWLWWLVIAALIAGGIFFFAYKRRQANEA